jgi:hypothetical protein
MDGAQALAMGGNFSVARLVGRDWNQARVDQGAERKGPRRKG